MSREVRRVPLGYRHPVEHNPHWQAQRLTLDHQTCSWVQRPEPKLHATDEKFIPMFGPDRDYESEVATWDEEMAQLQAMSGIDWDLAVGAVLTGFEGRSGWQAPTHTGQVTGEHGEQIEIAITTEQELLNFLIGEKLSEYPDPDRYMPVFDQEQSLLGYCLYSTTTEGHPLTPVFASAEELIEHLVQVGEDGRAGTYRREAAQALVSRVTSIGTFVGSVTGILDSALDADRI